MPVNIIKVDSSGTRSTRMTNKASDVPGRFRVASGIRYHHLPLSNLKAHFLQRSFSHPSALEFTDLVYCLVVCIDMLGGISLAQSHKSRLSFVRGRLHCLKALFQSIFDGIQVRSQGELKKSAERECTQRSWECYFKTHLHVNTKHLKRKEAWYNQRGCGGPTHQSWPWSASSYSINGEKR
ncbi:uncharacterized protein CLUP02_06040 [Colletotrichum lupini]|uniref:Uncharacterized protein n=1 Tax=Colletotrichum lupini TaxID=145971 RepID=A0A9Q8WF64_9PEZI|nr:uncharacterized protein CLUP02_06040 [Colletotrichum lupini]UQC80557.1 hypothetical protein CLUP02_06040 [Colletotrichum lupini]